MTVPMIKSIGDVPYPIDTHSDVFSPLLTAGAALGITGNDAEESAWLARTSGADGVASVRSIHGNTIVQDDALVSVNMSGVETTGFNQWDEEWEVGEIADQTGQNSPASRRIRTKNFIPCFANTSYYLQSSLSTDDLRLYYYDADKGYIGHTEWLTNGVITTPAGCRYMRFATGGAYGATYKHDICINLSDPTRNGEYEPYWQQQRTIPAGTLRSAGTVYDELTATERITRVGVVDLGTLTWTYSNGFFRTSDLNDVILRPANNNTPADAKCSKYEIASWNSETDKSVMVGRDTPNPLLVKDTAYTDAATFKAAMSGVMLHYALATPTTTPIDPPLNMTYRTAAGGTERIIVPTGENSAPPTIVTTQGYTAESLRDAALSAIAPVENGLASTNYAVGSYLVHDGQLCKVTTAIATGEAITIGTNVTATTVMAEVIALIAQ